MRALIVSDESGEIKENKERTSVKTLINERDFMIRPLIAFFLISQNVFAACEAETTPIQPAATCELVLVCLCRGSNCKKEWVCKQPDKHYQYNSWGNSWDYDWNNFHYHY